MRAGRVLCVIIGLAALLAPLRAEAAPGQGRVVPDRYIVVLRDGVVDADAETADLATRHGAVRDHVYGHALKGFAGHIPPGKLKALANDPRVDFISEDREVSISQQTVPTGVSRINAGRTGNIAAGVNVAVLDTGIDLSHPDLAGSIAGGKNCSTGKSYADGNGHGTHVAGIIAARSNATGVVGVAPGARLWAVRVLNDAGSGTWSSIICGLDFVYSKSPARRGPIVVANLSLSGAGADDRNCGLTNRDALHKAICKTVASGVTVVVAAGNNAGDLKDYVPAAYDEVIAVTALGDSDGYPCGVGGTTGYSADDAFASFSNYATLTTDAARVLAAPGVSILSTWPGGRYALVSGTSMAAPHVAGAAALYLARYPGTPPAVVRDALRALAEPVNQNYGGECAIGVVSHLDLSGRHPEPVVRADGL